MRVRECLHSCMRVWLSVRLCRGFVSHYLSMGLSTLDFFFCILAVLVNAAVNTKDHSF